MKKIFAQLNNGLPINVDVQNAIDGFDYLNYDIKTYTLEDLLSGKMDAHIRTNPFVGSITAMTNIFKRINKLPKPIDFPEQIINSGLINRHINQTYLKQAIEVFEITNIPVFIKPIQTKLFDGILISQKEHLSYFNSFVENNPEVFVCSEINIVSEHRAYVHKGKMIYCCCYNGDFKVNPNYNYIESLIQAYTDSPISYTIDVAVLDDGNMTAIEFNDFWAIGSYGLYCINYAQMLLDRYCEILSIEALS